MAGGRGGCDCSAAFLGAWVRAWGVMGSVFCVAHFTAAVAQWAQRVSVCQGSDIKNISGADPPSLLFDVMIDRQIWKPSAALPCLCCILPPSDDA